MMGSPTQECRRFAPSWPHGQGVGAGRAPWPNSVARPVPALHSLPRALPEADSHSQELMANPLLLRHYCEHRLLVHPTYGQIQRTSADPVPGMVEGLTRGSRADAWPLPGMVADIAARLLMTRTRLHRGEWTFPPRRHKLAVQVALRDARLWSGRGASVALSHAHNLKRNAYGSGFNCTCLQ
jgi:hypothetical protein